MTSPAALSLFSSLPSFPHLRSSVSKMVIWTCTGLIDARRPLPSFLSLLSLLSPKHKTVTSESCCFLSPNLNGKEPFPSRPCTHELRTVNLGHMTFRKLQVQHHRTLLLLVYYSSGLFFRAISSELIFVLIILVQQK